MELGSVEAAYADAVVVDVGFVEGVIVHAMSFVRQRLRWQHR